MSSRDGEALLSSIFDEVAMMSDCERRYQGYGLPEIRFTDIEQLYL